MKFFVWLFRLLGLFAVLGVDVALHAQPAGEPFVTKRFRVVSWVPGQPEGFSYLTEGKQVIVKDLSSSLRSAMFDYTGPATLSIYPRESQLLGTRGAPPPPMPEPLAKISLPADIQAPLIVLAPNPGGPQPFRALVLEDDPGKFPFGSYLLVNFSQKRVAASMGKHRFIIEPGQRNLVQNDERAFHLKMAVPRDQEEGWRMIYDTFFPNWDNVRTLVFMVDAPAGDASRVSLRTLLENKAVWDRDTAPRLASQNGAN